MCGSVAPNAPYGMNGHRGLVTIGCGSPPRCAYGLIEPSGRIFDERAVAERRRVRVDQVVLAVREVVGEPVGRTNRHAAVSGHVPREPDARREIPPLLVQPAPPRREARVAGIDETGRRVREHRALDVVPEVVEAEVVDRAVQDVLSEVRLPAKARVDRHAAARSPGVLRVEPQVPLVHRQDRGAAVLQPADAAHQEVREAEAGQLARESPVAAGARVRLEVDIASTPRFAPTRDLVAAAHEREVVAQLRRVRHELARARIRRP